MTFCLGHDCQLSSQCYRHRAIGMLPTVPGDDLPVTERACSDHRNILFMEIPKHETLRLPA